jgi:hypothetical protein
MITALVDWVRYHAKMRRLQKARRDIQGRYDIAWRDADKKNVSENERNGIYSEWDARITLIEDHIAQLTTRYLCAAADRYQIPTPSRNDDLMWTEARSTYRPHLTPAGIAELRGAIRKEQRESSEIAWRWLTGFTGLIGTFAGLIAAAAGLAAIVLKLK